MKAAIPRRVYLWLLPKALLTLAAMIGIFNGRDGPWEIRSHPPRAETRVHPIVGSLEIWRFGAPKAGRPETNVVLHLRSREAYFGLISGEDGEALDGYGVVQPFRVYRLDYFTAFLYLLLLLVPFSFHVSYVWRVESTVAGNAAMTFAPPPTAAPNVVQPLSRNPASPLVIGRTQPYRRGCRSDFNFFLAVP
jgi:hypothetical protein